MSEYPGVPVALREAIARDLRPVSPLPRPLVRSLWLVPLAAVLLVASAAAFGLRRDAGALGPMLTWGASIVEMAIGLALIAAALRESVPGTTLTRMAAGLAIAVAAAAVAIITWTTWKVSPIRAAPPFGGFVWRVCFGGTLSSALPAVALAGWLVARAFPLRPAVAGALYGLGAGLLADAGWRLFCHFPGPAHVFGAHALAVGASCGLGVLLAVTLAGRARR